ncbi:DUF1949 domain-containing protein [Permianibacter sp. IMCC34836]|uniref:IMPACT family protein n=1 Tax=Permianibacter fluminis TaxID=2738515 RepID=UPI001553CE6C|nr:YigZ family protein [Permianibacter fluminis]NQD38099.1 DUF1949 domain-containing protein [Permianibacter fluminis]
MNRVPAATLRHEIEVKRSRFIATVARAGSRSEAEQVIASVRAEFADATHNAFAYIAGMPGNTADVACSDDGEVVGTAGRPLLNLLQHSELAEVVVVVSRYYGGTLLGSGGLVRAYSQALKDALALLPTLALVASCSAEISFAFALEASVRRELARIGANVLSQHYGERVNLQIQLPITHRDEFRAVLDSLSKGQAIWRDLQA